jgi:hypothetical protein
MKLLRKCPQQKKLAFLIIDNLTKDLVMTIRLLRRVNPLLFYLNWKQDFVDVPKMFCSHSIIS